MKKIYILIIAILTLNIANAQPGTIDSTFGTNGYVITPNGNIDSWANAVVAQTDGKILVAGTVNLDFSVIRYNSNGNLDSTFGTNGKAVTPIGSSNDFVYAMALQNDGKILVSGYFYGTSDGFAVVRYTTNGTRDSTFGTNGIAKTYIGDYGNEAYAMVIQPDEKIIIAGSAHVPPKDIFALVRYNSNGVLDSTFGTNGIDTTSIGTVQDKINAVALQSDGKIVAAGTSSNGTDYDFALARFNSNGTLDSTFGTNGKVTTPIGNSSDDGRAVAIQTDGKIVVAGDMHNGANYDFALVRYNSDGTLDNTFGTNGKVVTDVANSDDMGYAMLIKDGKILVAGESYVNTSYDFALLMYNPNGTLDNTFGIGGKATTPIGNYGSLAYAMTLQSDGKVVLAGKANNGSNFDFAVARYNNLSSVGIFENNINNNISLYPNPTKDNLTIETNLNIEQKLEIINLIGQTIYTNSINKKATINTSAFANGVYILKLSSDKEIVVRKFVKE
ncbi:MAG: T9SS type A sorting domain-containing protein [Bacteroidota bacterium]